MLQMKTMLAGGSGARVSSDADAWLSPAAPCTSRNMSCNAERMQYNNNTD